MSRRWRGLLGCLWILLLAGCSTYGTPINRPLLQGEAPALSPSFVARSIETAPSEGVTLVLAFSGGGTRAAALAYGVLEALRDTQVTISGQPVRLLDEVDFITSVSGGSITAAYYGLFRERIFDDFRARMLQRNLADEIVSRLFHPSQWFSRRGRSDVATEVLAQSGFGDATFSDLALQGPPVIVMNATDLSRGVRFSFSQEYFDLICSDLAAYPVVQAVMASAAVPVVFDPVVLRNYDSCDKSGIMAFLGGKQQGGMRPTASQAQVMQALQTYLGKEERPFLHLVDGGITDNLGLRAVTDTIELLGGPRAVSELAQVWRPRRPSRHFVVIAVNASIDGNSDIDRSPNPPSVLQTLNAVSDAQIHLYNSETVDHTRQLVKRWANELSTAERSVSGHFVVVDIQQLADPERRAAVNRIPTTLGLPKKDVDMLVKLGRELLLDNAEYRALLAALTGSQAVHAKDGGP